MAVSPRPKQRRVQWRLRSFLLLVGCCALGIWLAQQADWMHRRHAALEWMRSHPDEASYASWVATNNGQSYQLEWDPVLGGPNPINAVGHGLETAAPWSLRLLGEPGVTAVSLRGTPEQLQALCDRFGKLFPEAQLTITETPPPRPHLPPGRVASSGKSWRSSAAR